MVEKKGKFDLRSRRELPIPRGTIDNALTAAFRTVVGWDPVRDGLPPGIGIWRNRKYDKFHMTSPVPPRPLPKRYVFSYFKVGDRFNRYEDEGL